MNKKLVLFYLALGMMSGGFYNDAFAMNTTEQTAERQERVLTQEDAKKLIEEMKARGSTELVIPNGYTSIDQSAFIGFAGLTSIEIPDSVTSIGNMAFYNCRELTSVTVSKKLQSIGLYAFSGCHKLASIAIPDSVMSIDNGAFESCNKCTFIVQNPVGKDLLIKSGVNEYRIAVGQEKPWWIPVDGKIVIPYGTEQIKENMFKDRCDITSAEISDGIIDSISDGAFAGCSELTSISIPKSVTSIGIFAFKGCTKLNKIYISDSVTSIGEMAFEGCTGLTSIDLKNVASIGCMAFKGCTGLTSIDLKNVKSIGSIAFKECENLRSITVAKPNNFERVTKKYLLDKHTYVDSDVINEVELRVLTKEVVESGFFSGWISKHTTNGVLTIPDEYTYIDDKAFMNKKNIKHVVVSPKVIAIGKDAFSGCTELESIDLKNVTSIGESAFFECKKLKSVKMPNRLKSIYRNTFACCHELEAVDLNNVTLIGASAFEACSKLNSIDLKNVENIGENAFFGCRNLTSIIIPDCVRWIGDSAFRMCDNLKNITVYDDKIQTLLTDSHPDTKNWPIVKIEKEINSTKTRS